METAGEFEVQNLSISKFIQKATLQTDRCQKASHWQSKSLHVRIVNVTIASSHLLCPGNADVYRDYTTSDGRLEAFWNVNWKGHGNVLSSKKLTSDFPKEPYRKSAIATCSSGKIFLFKGIKGHSLSRRQRTVLIEVVKAGLTAIFIRTDSKKSEYCK